MNGENGISHNPETPENKREHPKHKDIMDALYNGELDEVTVMLGEADLTETERKQKIVEMLYDLAREYPLQIEEYMRKFSLGKADISTEQLVGALEEAVKDLSFTGEDESFNEMEMELLIKKLEVAKKYGVREPEKLVDDSFVIRSILGFVLNNDVEFAEECMGIFGLTKDDFRDEARDMFRRLISGAPEPESKNIKKFADYFGIEITGEIRDAIIKRYLELIENGYLAEYAKILKDTYGLTDEEINEESDYY